MLEEKIFLYNTLLIDANGIIYKTCQNFGASVELVKSDDYGIPLGFLAYGNEEQKMGYSGKNGNLDKPMMLFAGFTPNRLNDLLSQLRLNKAPHISLKAGLTEHNATWNSYQLFKELVKEDNFFKSR